MNEIKHISAEVKQLDINLNYGELYFENGDEFTIQIESKYENDFCIAEKGDCLKILDERKNKRIPFVNRNNERSTVKLTIPTDFLFERIRITTGAGELYADTIQTAQLITKMGAGEFHIKQLSVFDYATLDGGAGEIEVENGNLHNLSMSFGAGEVNMHAVITGNSQINAGVGELNLALLGNPSDYSATISKGIGHCSVRGFNTCHGNTYGDGPNKLKISGGVGEINISFA